MQNIDNKQYVEAIKLAVGSVQYKNLSVKETFFETIERLNFYYENSQNEKYLEVALLHMQAYLEMGFPYETGKELFDATLAKMGTKRELKFPKNFYASKEIKLNKSQVRSMIKKWASSPHQTMKIDEVVADIIKRVSNREIGIYYYECAVSKDRYELTISEDEIFFHDLKRGIFYTFLV